MRVEPSQTKMGNAVRTQTSLIINLQIPRVKNTTLRNGGALLSGAKLDESRD